jgi:hypothetical protein
MEKIPKKELDEMLAKAAAEVDGISSIYCKSRQDRKLYPICLKCGGDCKEFYDFLGKLFRVGD